MIALTRNHALDRLRSSKRREAAMKEFAELPSPENSGLQVFGANGKFEAAELVRQSLSAFAPKQRRALELALLHGFT